MKMRRGKSELIWSLANLIVFVTVRVSTSQAQVSLFQRDQRAWLMQFVGTWQTKVGEDTEIVWQATPAANEKALHVHSSSRVNGALVREAWGMWAFDPDIDRIVCMTVLSTGEILQATGSFAKRSKLQLTMSVVPLPIDRAATTTMELKPPDTFEVYQTDSTRSISRIFVYTCIGR